MTKVITVCIDSQICVWGIKQQSIPEQIGMIEKARSFFEWLDEEKYQVMLPSIVIAELLTPEPIELHAQYLEVLKRHFMIADFNDICALKYAEILKGKLETGKQYIKDNDVRREKMKFDFAIVACAISNGASCIYSYDKDVKKFAEGLIDVRPIPDIPYQTKIIFDPDEKNPEDS